MSNFKYEVVKQDQELLFSSIQKIANRIVSAIDPPRQLLLGRLSNLQDFWERCRKNHIQLTTNTPSADQIDDTAEMYNPDKFFEVEEVYEDAVDLILSKLPDQPINQRARDRSPSRDNSTTTNARSSTSSVHLPRINIPTFSGSYSEWLSFRDLFTSLIINNDSISDAERLHYLKLSLKDEALIIAQNQPGTADDFQVIWRNLETRYNNSKALIFDYLKKITDFPDVTSDFLNSLKSLRNLIITVTTALKNLQRPIDEGNDLFIFILINKLDKLSRDQWELLVSDTTDPPSLDQFNKFLDSRIRALEASATTKKRPEVKNLNNSSQSSPASRPKIHAHQSSSKFSCILCKKDHNLYLCPQFKSKSVDERSEYIRSNQRCFNCLGKHHRNVCESKNVCSVCKKQHHSLLHRDQNVNTASLKDLKLKEYDNTQDASSSQNKSEIESFQLSNHLNATEKRTAVLLATARVIVEAPDGRRVQVRALLDQGSEASFVSESVAQLLRLPRKSSNVSVSGLGGNFSKKVLFSVPLVVKPVKSGPELFTTRAFVLPKITSYIPTEFALSNIPSNLRDLEFADPCPWSTEPIDLLIGADLYGRTLCTNVNSIKSENLVAQPTVFGWILSGPVQVPFTQSHHVSVHLCVNEMDNNLRRLWELEEIPSDPILTKAERECETYFSETTERLPSGKFQVKLPFNQSPTLLGDSLKIAIASLNRLEKKFASNEDVASDYRGFLYSYLKMGHMTCLGPLNDSNSQKVFIPHHCIIRELSQTTKLRVVFNASRPTSNGISLNDCLHIGPKLLNDILSIILRWRQHQFVLCADIANMFRQILVSPEDRKYQCILWRDSADLPLQVYELNTVTYGMRSSPYLANRVMRQLALDEQVKYPIAASVLYNDTYVDDTFVGGSDKPSTIKLRDNLIKLTQSGGFPLRKWCSNDPDLLQGLSEIEHGIAVEIPLGESLGFKVLGIFWEPSTDAFIYRFSKLSSENPSKRTLLSAVASLFDPMGWISPVTITVKILLQKLWLRKLDWDDELPSDLVHEWSEFCAKLPCLSQVSIPRWLATDNNLVSTQIHGFSDASSIAYGAAVYCRVIDSSGNISVKLLIAKTRVAPLKTISIPRLELLAAALLSTLIKFVIKSLGIIDVPIFCWTDSTIVLSWLQKQPSTWTVFVANRVSSIQTDLPTAVWNHVPSKDNPADSASRGISAENFDSFSLWWNGPPWLSETPESWPRRNLNVQDTTQEKRISSHAVTTTNEDWQMPLLLRQSSWAKLLRITAYVLRAVKSFKLKLKFEKGLSANEIHDSVQFWIRYIQNHVFSREIASLKSNETLPQNSNLKKLNPFLDKDGIIRLGGRLCQSSLRIYKIPPAILPKHFLTRLILEQLHKNLLHAGLQLTLSMSRTQYWIIGGRSMTKYIIKRCIVCVSDKAQTENNIMGELPPPRVSPSRPFSHTGIDYAGPFMVRNHSGRGSKSHKTWIAIFVCLSIKAIHLELVHDYSTPTFLAAFRRFTSRRGIPSDIYSDNGTNFRGADRELSHTFRSLKKDSNLVNYFASDGTTWHFMPPIAPNFGGLWEAGVKSVKTHLRKLLLNSTPTAEELTTLLCQIESCLNSRPLVAINDDPESLDVLTPGHFLVGSALKIVPSPSLLNVNANYLTRWQFYQRILETFWRSWSRVYLQTLQQRVKWFSKKPNINIGDIVLLKNANSPPAKWDLTRVIKCISGRDGVVRVVHVKTSKSEYVRPISQLVLLPTSKDYDLPETV